MNFATVLVATTRSARRTCQKRHNKPPRNSPAEDSLSENSNKKKSVEENKFHFRYFRKKIPNGVFGVWHLCKKIPNILEEEDTERCVWHLYHAE